MELTVELTLERETKNTIRYEEVVRDQPPIIGTLYVQKWALKKQSDTVPRTLIVTIRAQ